MSGVGSISGVVRETAAFSILEYTQLFRERLSGEVHATIPKVIVVVLSSLFFKEIRKKCTRSHGHMLASAKGKQQK